YLALLPVGFAVPACCQARGALLPHHFTLATRALRRRSAVSFCCTFRRLAPPRRYLAPCPVEPGLSSAPASTEMDLDDATAWPTPPRVVYGYAIESPTVCCATPGAPPGAFHTPGRDCGANRPRLRGLMRIPLRPRCRTAPCAGHR